MRNAFAQELTELAKKDSRVIMLSGDIGNRLFDKYISLFPDRFFNCGIAEANMIGVAAGMALCGLKPIAYTITPFITTRCLEQIRVDLCYHNLPVILVGVGCGLSYAAVGSTHQACEDIGLLRIMPNMTVICPGDAYELKAAMNAAIMQNGPVYIRIGKKGEPLVHKEIPKFEIGKGIIMREGKDVCLLSTGNMLPIAMSSAEELSGIGVSTKVVSLHTVKPLDVELLKEVFSHFRVIATIEEHSILGGLGGSVAEWLADNPQKDVRLIRIGTADEFMHKTADQEYARDYFGLTKESIVKKIVRVWKDTE